VISADDLNAAPLPFVIVLHVVTEDPRVPRYAIRLSRFGWAIATTLESTLRSRVGYVVGQASAEEMAAVDEALRLAQGL
jgi:mRNA-degrading endonuclease toxin of MazEF toxin-antitoxin module